MSLNVQTYDFKSLKACTLDCLIIVSHETLLQQRKEKTGDEEGF